MLTAGKIGLKLFSLGSSFVLKTLARFTGADFLRDLTEFMLAFEGMYEGFKDRAAKVKALLTSRDAAFVLVTSPNPLTIQEALFFHEALRKDGIATAAVVVNRVQRDPRRHGGPVAAGACVAGGQVVELAGAAEASAHRQGYDSLDVSLTHEGPFAAAVPSVRVRPQV